MRPVKIGLVPRICTLRYQPRTAYEKLLELLGKLRWTWKCTWFWSKLFYAHSQVVLGNGHFLSLTHSLGHLFQVMKANRTENPLSTSSVTNLKELVSVLFPHHHIAPFLLHFQTVALTRLRFSSFPLSPLCSWSGYGLERQSAWWSAAFLDSVSLLKARVTSLLAIYNHIRLI